ncbi:acyltransferase [Pseudescherichia sp.]|uniref:acyltransferase family protein n=1 Tax=Pseudescherichia sp. TaxID=2055881 RepID=UPI0028A2290B|nr:acyltransferase [Pseudescherichia sp.]
MTSVIDAIRKDEAKNNNLGYLDGLRGICCFLVVIEHCINFYKPDIRFTELEGFAGMIRRVVSLSPLNFIYSGDISVAIFFILSGFVLSLKFNKTKNYEYILSGVVKRYPRIMLPVAASMLFMFFILLLSDKFIGHNFWSGTWDSFLFIFKQIMVEIPFTHNALTNYPLWTISYELFGSFLVFAILAIFGTSKYRISFYLFVMVYFLFSLENVYYTLFIFGVIICDLTKGGNFKISPGIRLILFVVGLFLATTPFPRDNVIPHGGFYIYLELLKDYNYVQVSRYLEIIGSMILFASLVGSTLSIKVLTTPLMRFLGKISFPLYLTHATIIYVISFVLKSKYGEVGFSMFLAASLLTVCISIPVAIFFERYIDMPSIKLSNKFGKLLCK